MDAFRHWQQEVADQQENLDRRMSSVEDRLQWMHVSQEAQKIELEEVAFWQVQLQEMLAKDHLSVR